MRSRNVEAALSIGADRARGGGPMNAPRQPYATRNRVAAKLDALFAFIFAGAAVWTLVPATESLARSIGDRAIEQVRPFGVDLCSGVEDAPGRKSESKLRRLLEAVRQDEESAIAT
jgi:hypothetical protein